VAGLGLGGGGVEWPSEVNQRGKELAAAVQCGAVWCWCCALRPVHAGGGSKVSAHPFLARPASVRALLRTGGDVDVTEGRCLDFLKSQEA
jgi:hypothetical protein